MRPGLRKGVYGIEAGEQSAANGAKEYRAHKPKGSEGRTVRSADAGRGDTAQAHIIHFLNDFECHGSSTTFIRSFTTRIHFIAQHYLLKMLITLIAV